MPEVIISYGHDSPAHKFDVHRLAKLLVQNGITTHLDEWVAERQDWLAWMDRHITSADFTLVIASPAYRAAGDGNGPPDRSRGVQAEAAIIRDLIYSDRSAWTHRILPVVLPGRSVDEIPRFLQPRTASHYQVDSLTTAGIESLLRMITGQPRWVSPPLGTVPVLPPEELPGTDALDWRVLPEPVEVFWRATIMASGNRYVPEQPSCVEVHLPPVGGSALPANRLRAVRGSLGQLFAGQGAEVREGDEVVLANGEAGGLAVLRNGQRSAWTPVPRAVIGHVLVPEDCVVAVHQLLVTLLDLDVPEQSEVAPTIGLAPPAGVRVGTREDLTRTSGAYPLIGQESIRLPASESLRVSEVRAHTAAVAEELVERLISRMRNPTP
ncbi:toll/interleukin-1 receptor domain-containing protein [Actinosynnema pretiosum]|uniref:SEFIR domain-containing protein n=1 Tax=Actinosynnema pretiosum TaxID=42197 RepID=A0A290Z8H1_9PSEU|nr:toll/interleukin-1 receptor domain-containing protein [Actinosynnema pretiosum]ATE55285.1 hypothetical protein CNX65_20015 [Actinosynnema pretiosum]